MSAWKSEEAMRSFVRTGAHLESMKHSADISTEIRTYTYQASRLPDWKEGQELLEQHGKIHHFH
jgi:hypothetical protein